MVRPLGCNRIGWLLYLSQADPSRLTDREGGRGLGAAGDVHLLRRGQLHGLLLRGLEDAGPSAGNQGAPSPAVPRSELDWAAKQERKQTTDMGTITRCGHRRRNTLGQMTIYHCCFHGCGWKKAVPYLSGVLGLPMIRRGERILGSKENFSLIFSRTDGAT